MKKTDKPDKKQQNQHERKPYKRPSNQKIIDAFYVCKAIITDVASYLNVERTTVYGWIKDDTSKNDLTLSLALEDAKLAAHDYVKGKLLSRIDGYEHSEEKVFMFQGAIVTHRVTKHCPPDVSAIQLYYTLEGLLINKTDNKNTGDIIISFKESN